MSYVLNGVEQFVSLGAAAVTSGGNTAPAAGTVQTWTVSGSTLPSASSSATPPTGFYVADPAQPSEVILVTNVSGTSLTVTRGADGTTPVAHSGAGFTIVQVETGETFRQIQLPWVVKPSGDTSGATDAKSVQDSLDAYNLAVLVPGEYYGNATVVGHEHQYVRGPGFETCTWTLTTTAIPAFQWTPANTSDYDERGGGGITGVTIIGPSGGVNPSDNSVGLAMGDIVHLESDVYIRYCQYGLLLSNGWFWAERGRHILRSESNTSPVLCRCSPAAGSTQATGSFDRTEITVYFNEQCNGSFTNGVEIAQGAVFTGGSIKMYGNFENGSSTTGQSGVYLLSVYGQAPAGSPEAGDYSNLFGVELIAAVESSLTTDPPGTIAIATNCYINAFGSMEFYPNFGSSDNVSASTFEFAGPIRADNTLLKGKWATLTSGFPASITGSVSYRLSDNLDAVEISVNLTIPASTSLSQQYFTLPSGLYPSVNKNFPLAYSPYGSGPETLYLWVNSSDGAVALASATATTPSGGSSALQGNWSMPLWVN